MNKMWKTGLGIGLAVMYIATAERLSAAIPFIHVVVIPFGILWIGLAVWILIAYRFLVRHPDVRKALLTLALSIVFGLWFAYAVYWIWIYVSGGI